MPIRPQAAAAAAADSSHFHVLSLGSTGANVKALQYLLRYGGFHPLGVPPGVPSLAADGMFGQRTEAYVRIYQRRTGRPVDGVVRADTWQRLTRDHPVRNLATSDKVSAITTLLNKFDFEGITSSSSGVWGRVTRFQDHARIDVDGIVGPNTWRNLVFQYEQPDLSKPGLCLGTIKGEDTNDYANDSWGTSSTVSFLERAAATFVGRFRNSPQSYPIPHVAIRDISRERGGDIGGHHTHKTGLEIDMRLMSRTNAHCTRGLTYTSSRYDKHRTLSLIRDLIAASSRFGGDHYQRVYFNDAWIKRRIPNVHWAKGTYNHLHIRFCTRDHAVKKYKCED